MFFCILLKMQGDTDSVRFWWGSLFIFGLLLWFSAEKYPSWPSSDFLCHTCYPPSYLQSCIPSDIRKKVLRFCGQRDASGDMCRSVASDFRRLWARSSFSILCFASAGWPHPRGAARVGEHPPAQAGAAGGHSGKAGIEYRQKHILHTW